MTTRQHHSPPQHDGSQPRAPGSHEDSNSRRKLESASSAGDVAQMKCARCGCDLRERVLVFTMMAGKRERKLCSVCWPKELSGGGELAGSPGPAARSATR